MVIAARPGISQLLLLITLKERWVLRGCCGGESGGGVWVEGIRMGRVCVCEGGKGVCE